MHKCLFHGNILTTITVGLSLLVSTRLTTEFVTIRRCTKLVLLLISTKLRRGGVGSGGVECGRRLLTVLGRVGRGARRRVVLRRVVAVLRRIVTILRGSGSSSRTATAGSSSSGSGGGVTSRTRVVLVMATKTRRARIILVTVAKTRRTRIVLIIATKTSVASRTRIVLIVTKSSRGHASTSSGSRANTTLT